MSVIDASLLIISGLFGVYALTAAVEYGIVIKMLGRDEVPRRMFAPLWEVTNVFLVFGFTGLTILFNGALSIASRDLLGLLAVGVVAILIRASIVLVIFYAWGDKQITRPLLWLFAITTMLIPLIFSAAGIYFLSGQMFWHSLLGIVLWVSCLVGLSAVGLNILERKLPARRQLPAQLLAVAWLMLLGSILPAVALHSANHLSRYELTILAGLAAGSLGLMLINFARASTVKIWPVLSLVCVAVPMILAWADRPYLISGRLTLASAYGASSYGSAIVIALAIMAPLIFIGLYLFVKLLASAPAAPKIESR